MQRLVRAHAIEHVRHEIDGNPAIVLGQLAAALIGKTRPQAHDVPGLVCDDAVELQRRIDQLHHFEIAVAEAHRARQRQFERIDAGNLSGARAQVAVAAHSYDPDAVTSGKVARRQLRRFHRRRTDQLRVVLDDSEIVQRVDVEHTTRYLHGAGERNRHVADPDGHRITINNDQAALSVDDEAGPVIVALRDSGNGIRHVERNHRQ